MAIRSDIPAPDKVKELGEEWVDVWACTVASQRSKTAQDALAGSIEAYKGLGKTPLDANLLILKTITRS